MYLFARGGIHVLLLVLSRRTFYARDFLWNSTRHTRAKQREHADGEKGLRNSLKGLYSSLEIVATRGERGSTTME